MRIAFYAPMKSPDHPSPSGDRAMARLLVRALQTAGHEVTLASTLRSYAATPDAAHYASIYDQAQAEVARLMVTYGGVRPDLWLTYHPYYKSPDLIGPDLSAALDIPYATAEASWSARRGVGEWKKTQAAALAAVKHAVVNICFTERDREGLEGAAPDAAFAMLPPFLDVAGIAEHDPGDGSRLITVAMMRPGDKLDSYRMLAEALKRLTDVRWTLAIVGDGPARSDVEAAFGGIPSQRLQWLGQLEAPGVREKLGQADIYVWPGCGEAYGLAYLEAQAAGLAVVAQRTAGVPEVVRGGFTGILTPEGDTNAFAEALRQLLAADGERISMGKAARDFVRGERSLNSAALRLDEILKEALR